MNDMNEKTRTDSKSALSWAMEGAKYVSSLAGVLSGLAGAVKLVQSFRSPLSHVGLQRRARTPLLGSLALLGAGVAVGAGLGLILAPASGAKTLRKIRRRIDEITGEEEGSPKAAPSQAPMKSMKNGGGASAYRPV